MKALLLLFLSLFLVKVCFSADVRSTLSPVKAHVGDELTLTIEVRGATGKSIIFPPPPGGGFELLTLDTSLVSKQGTMKYQLALFDTGSYTIPALPVIIRGGSTAETLRTTPLSARIDPSLSDIDTTIQKNKAYRLHPFQWRELKRWIWLPIVLILGFAGWWAWKRYFVRRGEAELPPELRLPAHELAVRELISLKDKKYAARGMLNEFFTEYSEVMRRYIERRYGFPALEMTTYDLEREFEDSKFPLDLTQRLLPSLRESDLVKFAKYLPPFEICDRYLNLGFEIVDLTKEKPDVPDVETKAA